MSADSCMSLGAEHCGVEERMFEVVFVVRESPE
jgi:hypothetical protein